MGVCSERSEVRAGRLPGERFGAMVVARWVFDIRSRRTPAGTTNAARFPVDLLVSPVDHPAVGWRQGKAQRRTERRVLSILVQTKWSGLGNGKEREMERESESSLFWVIVPDD